MDMPPQVSDMYNEYQTITVSYVYRIPVVHLYQDPVLHSMRRGTYFHLLWCHMLGKALKS